MPQRRVKCKGRCGQILPQNTANFGPRKGPGKYRRVCRKCEAEYVRTCRATRKLRERRRNDWAELYIPLLRRHSDGASDVSASDLRALLRLSEGRDPVDGRRFELPESAAEYRGWEAWVKTLDAARRSATPLIVRVTAEAPWQADNLVILPRWLGTFVAELGSLTAFKSLCERVMTLRVSNHSRKALDNAAAALRAEERADDQARAAEDLERGSGFSAAPQALGSGGLFPEEHDSSEEATE